MRIRILVVEDDRLQAEILTRALEANGYYVEVAHQGLQAVRLVLTGCFDLLLIDYQLPELDGLALARIVADLTRGHGTPSMVAITATPERLELREAGQDSIFDAAVAKPLHLASLLDTIGDCIARKPRTSYRTGGAPLLRGSFLGAATAPDAATTDTAGDDPPGLVLVIDDDPPTRDLLALALRAAGFVADAAPDGLQGLRQVAMRPYDVVVMDYRMPELDGLAVGRLIHLLAPGPFRPRLVALTAAAGALDEQESGQLSVFDRVIAKADGLPALLESIAQSVEYRRRAARQAPVGVAGLAALAPLRATG